jgi:ribosome maturation factor RimP
VAVHLELKTGESPFFVFVFWVKIMKPSKTEEKSFPQKTNQSLQSKEKHIVDRVWSVAEPLCLDEGMELVFIEFRRESRGRVLRLYIDKQGGVTLDDCVLVSHQLGDILDVTLEDIGPYSLEVSSPGTDRPIGRPEHYNRFKGQRIRIKTRQPIDGRKNYRGVLRGIDDGIVAVQCDNEEIHIPLEEISIARLVNFNGEN